MLKAIIVIDFNKDVNIDPFVGEEWFVVGRRWIERLGAFPAENVLDGVTKLSIVDLGSGPPEGERQVDDEGVFFR